MFVQKVEEDCNVFLTLLLELSKLSNAKYWPKPTCVNSSASQRAISSEASGYMLSTRLL